MKALKVGICVFCVCIAAGCSSFPDNNPIVLTSDSMYTASPSNNPSLSLPEEGFHGHLGFTYADKQDYSDSANETFQNYMVSTGLYYQPSLEIDEVIAPFYKVNLAGSYSQIVMNPNPTAALELQNTDMPYLETLSNCHFEGILQPGFLVKQTNMLLTAYAQGIVKYEAGDYRAIRQKIDGVANIYNIADNQLVFGYGYGLEIQAGYSKYCDVGIAYGVTTLFNKTQSVKFTSLEQEQIVINGGTVYRAEIIKYEPYIDYKHLRISTTISSTGMSTISCTYRF